MIRLVEFMTMCIYLKSSPICPQMPKKECFTQMLQTPKSPQYSMDPHGANKYSRSKIENRPHWRNSPSP